MSDDTARPADSSTSAGGRQPLETTILVGSAIASALTILALGWFLVSNLRWFQETAFPREGEFSPAYYIHVHHLFLATLKRSVALFTGFSLTLLGLGVAFYTIKDKSEMTGHAGGASIVIASSSPGIIAMILGVAMIAFTIHSKDTFPAYAEGAPPSQIGDQSSIPKPAVP